ncbi:hypothetical protein CSUI_006165 [Cystoisospora suis]|uniref:Uncharacterized protein n=1 Tax=Cystoisospora suis TaxID=483139 RepID=A0A2C6KVF8_9APIC|nr:hypothetical protein CSUI_006165 [Cystoisospora suis]
MRWFWNACWTEVRACRGGGHRFHEKSSLQLGNNSRTARPPRPHHGKRRKSTSSPAGRVSRHWFGLSCSPAFKETSGLSLEPLGRRRCPAFSARLPRPTR